MNSSLAMHLVGFVSAMALLGVGPTLAEPQPLTIENGVAQLFIDDHLIGSQKNLKRTLHQPRKDWDGRRPLIEVPEGAFDGHRATHQANGSIVHDPKIQKMVMFALCFCSSLPEDRRWEKVRLYRYTSNDGVAWEGGDWVFPRSREDFKDEESGEYATNMDLFSCYYDKDDPDFPYKGWCWFANWGGNREGAYLLKSKNGIDWQRGGKVVDGYGGANDPHYRVIEQDGRKVVGVGDVTTIYKDPLAPRFLGIFKFFAPEKVENDNQLRSRAYKFLEDVTTPVDVDAIDHLEFLPPAAERDGDHPHDEYYASTGWRYESLWLGGLKVWHGKGDYPYSPAGSAYLKLAVSRDGLNWSKVPFDNDEGFPEVFVANGPEGGNGGKNDGGYITEFSTAPYVSGAELIYFYGASSYGKNQPGDIRVTGGGIFRSRLRIDGFVSVDRGTLTTQPLAIDGEDLTLNSRGPLKVEVLDHEGKVRGSAVQNGDSIRHDIRFDGKSLGALADSGPIRLRFTVMEGGELYSFTVWDGTTPGGGR